MYIIDSYSLAVIFCIITMICWGSWANTLKLSSRDWPFQLYYWDYCIGLVLTALLLAFTLGSLGNAGVTCLGNDMYANELMHNFTRDGIRTDYIFRDPVASTGSALIMLDRDGNNYLSVAPGANYRLLPRHIDQSLDAIKQTDLIVMQMEIPFGTTAYVFEQAGKYGKKILFNLASARPFDLSMLRHVYAFVVNEVEASMVTGLKVETDEEIIIAADKLLALGPSLVIITLGARGSYIASAEYRQFIPAFRVKAVDTTAAGDVYCGSLAVAIVEGKILPEAVRFAGAASALSVTRLGAQPSAPKREEIEELLKRL